MTRAEYETLLQEKEDELPVFYQPWWLDAVSAGRQWSVAATSDGEGRITGILPYAPARRLGLAFVAPLPLSFGLGPWVFYPPNPDLKAYRRRTHEWKVLTDLAGQLPAASFIGFKSNYRLDNGLPLQRAGFQQATRYSYVLPSLQDEAQLWDALAGKTRTAVRKAGRALRVTREEDVELPWELTMKAVRHRQEKLHLPLQWLQQLDQELSRREQRRIYVARDEEKRVHAALYLVWDHLSAYNLLLGSDPDLRQSGAAALLLWEAIKDSRDLAPRFDFEGSQIPGVEEFYRSFGAELWPYYEFTKAARWLRFIRG